jgi:hypothetical protein
MPADYWLAGAVAKADKMTEAGTMIYGHRIRYWSAPPGPLPQISLSVFIVSFSLRGPRRVQ